jgi:radical SAM protein with 4Fe4S-binding SPASM domain
LKDIVPIITPFTFLVTPSQRCNFRCWYCAHTLAKEKRPDYNDVDMSFDMFCKIIEQSKRFPDKYKMLQFGGLGEPLLNKDIVHFIEKAHEVTDRVEMITNGLLLNRRLTDAIIDVGLRQLRISIQGTDAAKYKKVTSVAINFEKFIDELTYFYERSRGKTVVYMKIMDDQLEDKNDEKKFFSIFGNICDKIMIEHIGEIHPAKYGKYEKDFKVQDIFGESHPHMEVCPFLFYYMNVDAEGYATSCCLTSTPGSFRLGNINETPLIEMWNGESHKELMLSHLRINSPKKPTHCRICNFYNLLIRAKDYLDYNRDDIIKRVEEL